MLPNKHEREQSNPWCLLKATVSCAILFGHKCLNNYMPLFDLLDIHMVLYHI